MLETRWIVGFAGHREGWNAELVTRSLEQVLGELRDRAVARGGGVEFFSSVARGADLAAQEVARSLGIPNHVVLPLDEEQFRDDFQDDHEAWARAKDFIRSADAGVNGATLRVTSGARHRPDCYFDAGLDVVSASDVLVSVWDSQLAAGTGGTAEIVKQAQAEGVPVIRVDARTGTIDQEDLPAHWPKPDPIVAEINHLLGPASTRGADMDDLVGGLDQIATHEAERFRPTVVLAIVFHGLATLLAALAASSMVASYGREATTRNGVAPHGGEARAVDAVLVALTAAEFVLVALALLIVLYQTRVGMHHRWMRTRLGAELLRGLRRSRFLIDPLTPHIRRHAPEWKRFCLSAALLARKAPAADVDWRTLRDAYVKHIEDQEKHFTKRLQPARTLRKLSRAVVLSCASMAFVFVGVSLLNKWRNWYWHLDFVGALAVVWLPIALPLIAGMFNGIRTALDTGRRTSRYPDMVNRLSEMRSRLAKLQTRSSVAATVNESEELLVDEVLEWYVATRDVEAL